MSRDETRDELVRLVEVLEKKNNELERQIAQVEKDRTEYLQNVSHQLVAPLNAMKWHIENLTSARIGVDRAKKVLRSVYSQATLAVHLAKNFNLMSNLEGEHALSKLKEPLQRVGLYRLLVNLADDFQPLAWDREITIGVEDGAFESAPDVLAMKPLVSQVFSNIIENAVKYSDNGRPIQISGSYDSQSDSVQVVIRNYGIQLSPNHVQQVFERGFRSEDAIRKYPAGTGFGMYIARRIVELHEGMISARSDEAATEFIVILLVSGLEGKARVRD